MNKKSILLVNSVGTIPEKNKFYVGAIPAQSLSLGYLASSLEAHGFTAPMLAGTVDEKELLSAIEEHRPIAIGFSTYTFTYPRALNLARLSKEKAKSLGYTLFNIFGGYHVSCIPEEAIAEDIIDFVVKGEGENTICELMNALNTSQDFKSINGLLFKKNGQIIKNPPTKRIRDIDSLPLPKREINHLRLKAKDRNLGYPPASLAGNSALMNYSRGCPFACSFCTSRSIWEKKIFWRSPKAVVDEMEWLLKNYNVDNIAFLDLTFNANREKVIEFCDELIKRNLPTIWGCMVRLDLLDKTLVQKMAAAKCSKFSLGIESPIDHLANAVKDSYHAQTYTQNELLNEISQAGIITRAFLIIGFPLETKKILDSYIESIKYFPVDELRVTIATPFPGTSFWKECQEKKLIPDPVPWEKFTTADAVILHPHLTDEDIYSYREKLITTFFFSENYQKRLKEKFKKFPQYKTVWKEYFECLSQIEILKGYEKELNKLFACFNKT